MDIQLNVTVPKELNDALVALKDLVVAIKANKPLSELIAEELPVVIKLLAELQAIPKQVKEELPQSLDCALLQLRQLIFVLLS